MQCRNTQQVHWICSLSNDIPVAVVLKPFKEQSCVIAFVPTTSWAIFETRRYSKQRTGQPFVVWRLLNSAAVALKVFCDLPKGVPNAVALKEL